MSTSDDAFQAGLRIRREMFGPAGAEEKLAKATDLTRAFEELVTKYCFGEIWAQPDLDRKTRSLITLAILAALGKPNEFKVHVLGAINNGVTVEQIRAVIMHTAVYAGIPAGVGAFGAAAEMLAQIDGRRGA